MKNNTSDRILTYVFLVVFTLMFVLVTIMVVRMFKGLNVGTSGIENESNSINDVYKELDDFMNNN